MRASYDVRVTRDGSGPWEATVDDLTGATYARTLAKLDTYVRELVVLGDDLPDDVEDDVVLTWHFDDPQLQEAHDLARRLEELRREQEELVSRTHAEMRRLLQRGLSTRDVAVVARSTSGRVSQVKSRHEGKTKDVVVSIKDGKGGTRKFKVSPTGGGSKTRRVIQPVVAPKTSALPAAAKVKSSTPHGRS